MNKRYIMFIMLVVASLTKTEDAPDTTTVTRAGGTGLQKSTFFYAQTLSASEVITGKTLTAAGYYLLSGPVSTTVSGVALTITGSNITVDLDGNSIAFGSNSTIAISISDSAKNITIKNGTISGAFGNGAILVGNTTSNILLENITIDGPAGYGVNAVGTTGAGANKELTLRNVSVTKCVKTGAAIYPIDIDYAHGLIMENVSSSSAATTTSGVISGIRIQNSKAIQGSEIISCHHIGVGATIGLQMISCQNAILQNVNVSSNSTTVSAPTSGLVLTTCNNILISNLAADNLTTTLNNILIASSKNITIENATASNSTAAATTVSISMTASQSVLLKNVTIANNASTAAHYTGIATASTCKNITLENIRIQANTLAAGAGSVNMIGISLASTSGIEIVNSQVAQNTVSSGDTSRETRGLTAANTVTDLLIRNSQFNANSGATGGTTATGGLVAGVYLDGVAGCEIYNSQANRNFGTGRAYGFYITNVNGLVMNNCTANRNAAAIKNSTASGFDDDAQEGGAMTNVNLDGIEALPSAGLYLLTSDYAEVTDCRFINNRSGNFAPGVSAGAPGTPSIATSCSAHGVANIGIATTNPNIGNTFARCIFQGNNTQLLDVAPVEAAGGYEGGNHWVREAFAAGATEQFTSGSVYNDCQFNANGNACRWAVGFGLCVFTGCNTLYVKNSTASTNGWYGFYDSTATNHVSAYTGCVSSMNGVGNGQATTAITLANTRNYGIAGAAPYKSVTIADLSQLHPTGSSYINLSITPAA